MKTALLLVFSCCVVTGMSGSALAAEIAEPKIDPLDFIPEGMKGVVYVNIGPLADVGVITEVINFIAQFDDGDDGPVAVFKKMNLDPKKDIDAIAVAIEHFNDDMDGPPIGFVMTGRFDKKAIYKFFIEEDLFEPTSYKGYDLMNDNGDPLEPLMGILNGKVFVIGREAITKKIIDIYNGDAKPAAKDSPLMRRAKALRDNTFWFVADLELPPLAENGPGMMMPGLDPSKIQELTISGKVTKKDLALKVIMGCKDEDSAAGMVGGIKQGINMIVGMANMFTGGDADAAKAVGELIKAIKIGGKGKAATIDLTVTAQLAEKLKAIAAGIALRRFGAANIQGDGRLRLRRPPIPAGPPVNLGNDNIDWDADDDW